MTYREDETRSGETEDSYYVDYYVDTGVGYSVTDGVIITAKLRN